jgi:hypothetical protein
VAHDLLAPDLDFGDDHDSATNDTVAHLWIGGDILLLFRGRAAKL